MSKRDESSRYLLQFHEHKRASVSRETVEQSHTRRGNEREAIYKKHGDQVSQEDERKRPPPSAPLDAPEVLQGLYEAAHELWQQLCNSPEDWADGLNGYHEGFGSAVRAGFLDDPLVQKLGEGFRTFGNKKVLARYKNKVGRIPLGEHSMMTLPDFWIAMHAAARRSDGQSLAVVHHTLRGLLPPQPLPKGCKLSEGQKLSRIERVAAALLRKKNTLNPGKLDDPSLPLMARLAAIGRLWQREISRRLGTAENLRQQLLVLGIAPEADSSKKSCP